jgi:hypothetical protein
MVPDSLSADSIFDLSGSTCLEKPMDGERDLDFWLGEWQAAWDGGAGTNRITLECDDRVVVERFSAPADGFEGTSISVWDAGAGRWRQAWADSQGNWFHLEGGRRDGAFELVTTDGAKRMRFTDITAGSFSWSWQASEHGDWRELWRIDYTRSG